jgi:hypothetical protein
MQMNPHLRSSVLKCGQWRRKQEMNYNRGTSADRRRIGSS